MEKIKYPKTIKHRELHLGDTVSLADHPAAYMTADVIKIEGEEITLYRPYVHTSDFEYSGGLTPYIGIEQFKIYRYSDKTVTLLRRKAVK